MTLADAITPNTSVSVTIAASFSIVVALVGGTWRISALLNRLERRFDDLERKTGESWSLDDMRAWVRLIDRANKELIVPDPDLVTRDSAYRKHGTTPPHG
jgi:hypothetical protein